MSHLQLLAALVVVSTAMGCAPSCAPTSRIVRVPVPVPTVEPPKCAPLEQWDTVECELTYGAGKCRQVPGTLDSVLDCGTDKIVYYTLTDNDAFYSSGKCYTDGTTPTFVYVTPTGEMVIPMSKLGKVACVSGLQ